MNNPNDNYAMFEKDREAKRQSQTLGLQDAHAREHSNETCETFSHDLCPKCKTVSVPAEKVPDQTLRGCPQCLHEWFEDLNALPIQ